MEAGQVFFPFLPFPFPPRFLLHGSGPKMKESPTSCGACLAPFSFFPPEDSTVAQIQHKRVLTRQEWRARPKGLPLLFPFFFFFFCRSRNLGPRGPQRQPSSLFFPRPRCGARYNRKRCCMSFLPPRCWVHGRIWDMLVKKAWSVLPPFLFFFPLPRPPLHRDFFGGPDRSSKERGASRTQGLPLLPPRSFFVGRRTWVGSPTQHRNDLEFPSFFFFFFFFPLEF